MKFYKVPDPLDVIEMSKHDEIVDWLHTMTQEWEGDESGIAIHPFSGGEPDIAWAGDYVVEENGVFKVVKAADWDKFRSSRGYFTYDALLIRGEHELKVKMFFEEGAVERCEIRLKEHDELLILSAPMFFAVLHEDAFMLYESAAEQHQNETLGDDHEHQA